MEESYHEIRQQYLEQVWKLIREPSDEHGEGRRRSFFDICKAGGAEEAELKYHVTRMFSALVALGHFDTLAVLLRGIGVDDEQILDFLKSECLYGDWPIQCMVRMLQASGIKPDPQKMLVALAEVSANHGSQKDLDDLPE